MEPFVTSHALHVGCTSKQTSKNYDKLRALKPANAEILLYLTMEGSLKHKITLCNHDLRKIQQTCSPIESLIILQTLKVHMALSLCHSLKEQTKSFFENVQHYVRILKSHFESYI